MINIAILGFGLIGSGVADVLYENESVISKKLGESINVKYILDIKKIDDEKFRGKLTDNIDTIINDPEISLIVETMGGSHPAFEYSRAALEKGISVVTSNKEVVANFGASLLAAASENGARYFFEASVGGGIPIIRPMYNCLAANKINSIHAILNGTTNYILTKMEHDNLDFSQALADAQKKGYAEKNPSADIDGIDSCRKIAILSSLAFGKHLPPDKIHTEGITHVTSADIENAKKLGFKIKLIAKARRAYVDSTLDVIVAPMLISHDNPLYNIEDVFNGILINGNIIGDVMFYGRGAGKMPTASAVAADIIDALERNTKNISWEDSDGEYVLDYKLICYSYYVRGKFVGNAVDIKSIITFAEHVETNANGEFFFTLNSVATGIFERVISILDENKIEVLSWIRIL